MKCCIRSNFIVEEVSCVSSITLLSNRTQWTNLQNKFSSSNGGLGSLKRWIITKGERELKSDKIEIDVLGEVRTRIGWREVSRRSWSWRRFLFRGTRERERKKKKKKEEGKERKKKRKKKNKRKEKSERVDARPGTTKIHRDRFRVLPFFTFPEEAPPGCGCENRHPPTCYFVKHEPWKL